MPKPVYKRAKTVQLQNFQNKSITDILNKLKFNNLLRSIVTK